MLSSDAPFYALAKFTLPWQWKTWASTPHFKAVLWGRFTAGVNPKNLTVKSLLKKKYLIYSLIHPLNHGLMLKRDVLSTPNLAYRKFVTDLVNTDRVCRVILKHSCGWQPVKLSEKLCDPWQLIFLLAFRRYNLISKLFDNTHTIQRYFIHWNSAGILLWNVICFGIFCPDLRRKLIEILTCIYLAFLSTFSFWLFLSVYHLKLGIRSFWETTFSL